MLDRDMLHDEFWCLEELVALFTSVLARFFLFDVRGGELASFSEGD